MLKMSHILPYDDDDDDDDICLHILTSMTWEM
jgi:hypothetical protein